MNTPFLSRLPLRAGLALAALAAFAGVAAAQSPGLYDPDTLRTFEFTIASATWYNDLIQARTTNTDIRADLVVDRVLYKDVGVRFRGSSSFSAVGRKKSINVTMDAFVPGQRLMGYDSLNLSNGFNDPTLCREVLAYGILRTYMPAPQANYARVFINSTYFGLFINVQQPDGKFVSEWYKGNTGNRYRCDPPTRAGSGRSALQWLGTNLQDYRNAYELKTDLVVAVNPWEDVRELCNVLNNTPNNQLETELPKVLDVDQALWYLALNVMLVNLDSYVSRGNDYYLYHDVQHGQMEMLPWDMNESFGGFANGLSIAQRLALDPFYNQGNSGRPLLGKLYNVVPEWRVRYLHHVKTIIDESLDWRHVGPLVARYQALIDSSVSTDPNLIYTYQMFKDNVTTQMFVNSTPFRTEIPGLKQLCDGRAAYIRSRADYSAPTPAITDVRAPTGARPAQSSTVTAKVTGTAPVGEVTLHYRDIGAWQSTAMLDDGQHGDGAANDGVFGAFVPAAAHKSGGTVQYYVGARTVTAQGGAVAYLPDTAAFGAQRYEVGFTSRTSPISINEVVAINTTGPRDEMGETEDWIELYNASTTTVKVGGMFLTDDRGQPAKWKIPDTQVLAGGSALLIWCDNEPADGPLHATFKLSGTGERVWLFDTDGATLLSALEFGPQVADVSIGALSDGKPEQVAYKLPTPGQPNSTPCSSRGYWPLRHAAHRMTLEYLGVPRVAAAGTLRVAGGPVNGAVTLFVAAAAGQVDLVGGVHFMLSGPLAGPLVLPTGASGVANVPITIPNDPSLKGASVFLQAGGADAQGFTASNGLEVRICPN